MKDKSFLLLLNCTQPTRILTAGYFTLKKYHQKFHASSSTFPLVFLKFRFVLCCFPVHWAGYFRWKLAGGCVLTNVLTSWEIISTVLLFNKWVNFVLFFKLTNLQLQM